MPKETDVTGNPQTTPTDPTSVTGSPQTTPAQPASGGSQGVQVIRANYVEIPLTATSVVTPESAAELLDIRSAFFSGKTLTPDQLTKLVRSAEGGGGNGNCGIC